MAPPINFKPKPLDRRVALRCELDNAPAEHTEALLNVYHLLQEAQDHGWLDAVRGAIAGGHVAVTEMAKFANTREGVAMMRNMISLAKILGAIDPDVLHQLSQAIAGNLNTNAPVRREKPSLLKVAKMAFHSDVLRGSLFALGLIAALGKALSPAKR